MSGQPMYKPAQRDTQSSYLPGGKGADSVTAAKPGRASAARIKAELPPPAALMGGSLVTQETLYQRYGKRFMDIAGSLAAILLCLPFLPFVALAIKLSSRGPVLYRSIRLGQNQRPFTFYKFRSMVDGAHESRNFLLHLNEVEGPVFKIANDPRVTLVGRFLRRTSIDELPQLINVLRGDMSLVGPRPPIPEEVEKYEPWQRRRLDVKPGITCLWQISGRSKLGFDEWMRLDIQYIQHQSFLLDLKILLRTIPAVLSRDGAY